MAWFYTSINLYMILVLINKFLIFLKISPQLNVILSNPIFIFNTFQIINYYTQLLVGCNFYSITFFNVIYLFIKKNLNNIKIVTDL